VCGTPLDKAEALLRGLEPFQRHWYTGTVGWVSEQETQFVVAIRCAFFEKNSLHVYSGAGIVEGSVADQEWDELNSKILPWQSVLGVSGSYV
jgi:menaquinone-specific isochorismate synthase